MSICEVDENGWCARHQRRHLGATLKIALDPSERGEWYRARWDHYASGTKPPAVRVATPRKAGELCRYLVDTRGGETKDCVSCGGRVRLKLFDCGHPEHPQGEVTTKDCQKCNWYLPRATEPVNETGGAA